MAGAPTFLFCAGATKAGTTWLYDHLAAHPDCRFRSIKELHYFDRIGEGRLDAGAAKLKRRIARLRGAARLASGEAAEALAHRIADLRDWLAVLKRPSHPDFAAYIAYLTKGIGSERVAGDITPAYGLLPVPVLREMAGMAPDVRFVYLMRDPVARLWSHVRMLAARLAPGAGLRAAADALFDRVIAGDRGADVQGLAARGDYAGALARLDAAVDPRRLLALFTEEMLSPAGIARLSDFLGISRRPAAFATIVHAGAELPLRPDQAARARAHLAPQYDYIARRFGQVPAAWRANMERVPG